jgi:hypothetical protein
LQGLGLRPHHLHADKRFRGGRTLNTIRHLLTLRHISCRYLATLPGDNTPDRCAVRDLILSIDDLLGPPISREVALEIAWNMWFRLERMR